MFCLTSTDQHVCLLQGCLIAPRYLKRFFRSVPLTGGMSSARTFPLHAELCRHIRPIWRPMKPCVCARDTDTNSILHSPIQFSKALSLPSSIRYLLSNSHVARQSIMVTNPLTVSHLQPNRYPPHVLYEKPIALRIQNLIQPTRWEPSHRLIPPRRPIFFPVFPSVRQPVLFRKRCVRWRNSVHIPARDPAQYTRLPQQSRNHAHLHDPHRRAHRKRLEVRINNPQDTRRVVLRGAAHHYIRYKRIPPHIAVLIMDAHGIGQGRTDQRDGPISSASRPARLWASGHDLEPLPDPRMCE